MHDLQKWSSAVRGEQVLRLLHTSYATGCFMYNWIRWLHVEKISLGVFPLILWILPRLFTASFLHPDPPLSRLGSDLLRSFLKSLLVPSVIVLLYNMVLTTTSKPTNVLSYQRRNATIRGPRHFLRSGPLPSDLK